MIISLPCLSIPERAVLVKHLKHVEMNYPATSGRGILQRTVFYHRKQHKIKTQEIRYLSNSTVTNKFSAHTDTKVMKLIAKIIFVTYFDI